MHATWFLRVAPLPSSSVLARGGASVARQLLAVRAATTAASGGRPACLALAAAAAAPRASALAAVPRRFATTGPAPRTPVFPRGGEEDPGPDGFLLYWRDRPRWWIPLVWFFLGATVASFGSLAYTILYLLPTADDGAADKMEANRVALERGILTKAQKGVYAAVMGMMAAGLVYVGVRHNRHVVERVVYAPRTARVHITTPRLSGRRVVEEVPVADLSLTLAAKRALAAEAEAAAAGRSPAGALPGYVHFNVRGDWFPFFVSNKGSCDDREALLEALDGVAPRGLEPQGGPAPSGGGRGPAPRPVQ